MMRSLVWDAARLMSWGSICKAIFECACGAPEQLEDIIVPHGDERRNFFRGEGLSVGCVDAGLDFLGGVVVEQRAEDVGSVFSVGLGDDASEIDGCARRRLLSHVQPPSGARPSSTARLAEHSIALERVL